MLVAKVIGNVWSTKKTESLHALRLLFVQPLDRQFKPTGDVLLAADEIGAGDDELVIITQGTPAMQAIKRENPVPVDAVVVGIVDSFEMFNGRSSTKKP